MTTSLEKMPVPSPRKPAIGDASRPWIVALIVSLSMIHFASSREGQADESTKPSASGQKAREKMLVYIGTYTRGNNGSKGIYIYRLDLATGAMDSVGVAGDVMNPSFLAVHPNHRFLYSVGEVASLDGKPFGAVYAFAVQPKTGLLTRLNTQSSEGAGPCHLVVDATGKNVLVANYGSGSVACLPIGEDGKVRKATSFIQHEGSSVNPRRQAGPHAHSINMDPANRFAVAADLGLDKVLVYRVDVEQGKLESNNPPFAKVNPGAGPRHFAFHPSSRFAYVINEIHSTVTAFAYDADRGQLKTVQTISTLPESFHGNNSTAEVQVHPSGKFLYGSNRGHDSIAVFSINQETGTLRLVENESTKGNVPRNFGIDPTGTYLLAANQRSNDLFVFRIDAKTGELEATGQTVEIPSPVCVKFVPIPR